MNKFVKFAAMAVAAVAVLLIAGFLVLKLISDEQYKEWITAAVQSATGREFSIGSLELDFNTSLSLKADDIALANAPWAGAAEMLAVDHVEAELHLLPLLRGVADVRGLIDKAAIKVETNPRGESNWDMGKGQPETGAGTGEETGFQGLPIRPLIREFRVHNVELTLADSTGSSKSANVDAVVVRSVEDLELELSGQYESKPVKLSGNLGHVDDLAANESTAVHLDGAVGGSTLKVSGRLGPLSPQPAVELAITLDVPSVSEAASIAGLELAELGVAKVTARFTADGGNYALSDIDTRLDGDLATSSITGSVGSVVPLKDIALDTHFSTESLEDLMRQLRLHLPVGLPSSAQLAARVEGRLDQLGIKDFSAKVKDQGVSITASGSIEHVLAPRGVSASVSAQAESVAALSKFAGMDLPALGAVDLTAQIASDDETIRLQDAKANLHGEGVDLLVTGGVADLVSLAGIDARASAEIGGLPETTLADLEKLMARFDVKLPRELLPDGVKASARVHGGRQHLGLADLKAEARDKGLVVTLVGAVDDVLTAQGINASASAKADSTRDLSKYVGLTLPAFGALDVSAKVSSAGDSFSLGDVDAKLGGAGIDAKITGGVADLVAVKGIDSEVSVEIERLTEALVSELEAFLKQFDVALPKDLLPAGVKAHARVGGGLEQLSLTGLTAEVFDDGLRADLSGSLGDVLTLQDIDATLKASAESTSYLSKYAGRDLPDLAAMKLSGKVRSAAGTFKLSDLAVNMEGEGLSLILKGDVDDLRGVKGINAEVNSSITSLSLLSALAGTDLPDTQPVAVHGEMKSGDTERASEAEFHVTAETGGAKASVKGHLGNVAALDNIDVAVAVTASALSDFDELAGRKLPEKGPLSLTGNIRVQPDTYRLDDFLLTIDDQKASGNIGLNPPRGESDKPTVEGKLHVVFLDLTPLLSSKSQAAPTEEAVAQPSPDTEPGPKKEKREESEVEAAEQEVEASADRLFSSDPLPVELLRQYNADVTLTADRLLLGKSDLRGLQVKLALADGALEVKPIKSRVGGGTLDGTVYVDAHSGPARLDAEVEIKEAPAPLVGGALDFSLNLDGSGVSMAELMAGLNGQIVVLMTDGRLEGSFLTRFGRDIIGSILPFSKDEEYTTLECGILRLDIKDGIADFEDKLAAQLTRTTWRGGGKINLKTEELDVGIVPKPRKGLGISAGGMAGLVHVRGTLTHPVVRLDPKDVAFKYGKYMAAISTGGLSILAEGLLDKSQANVDVCAEISAGTVFGEAGEAPTEDGPAGEGVQSDDIRTEESAAEKPTVPPSPPPRPVPKSLQ